MLGQTIFTTKKNVTTVQGIPVNKYYSKTESDNKFQKEITISATPPPDPYPYQLWYDIS